MFYMPFYLNYSNKNTDDNKPQTGGQIGAYTEKLIFNELMNGKSWLDNCLKNLRTCYMYSIQIIGKYFIGK